MLKPGTLPRWLAAGTLCLAAGAALGDDGRHRDERDHAPAAQGDTGFDYEDAERAVRDGKARPLADIIAAASPQLGGEIVGIELERKQGRFLYEFKVVTPSGRLVEIHVDALTAEVLGREDD